MTDNFRKSYSVVGAILVLEILTQFYVIATSMFIGLGRAMEDARSGAVMTPVVHDVDPFAAMHAVNGIFIIPATILVLIGLSFGARYPWRTTRLTALLLVLVVIQLLLGAAGFVGMAALAGLHGLNAVLLLGLASYLAFRNWAFGLGQRKARLDPRNEKGTRGVRDP